MALVAVFLVIVGFNYLKIDLDSKPKSQAGNISLELDADWDDDGLNNREESYWNTDSNNPDTDGDGYLDGEETASSHDPLIPAPNDKIDNSNLTEKMSQLALAGLYEGSLKPGSPNFESSINNLATIIAEGAINNLELDLSKINLKSVQSNTASQQIYIEEFSKIFEELVGIFIEQMFNLEDNLDNIGVYGMAHEGVSKSFAGSASRYEKVFNELSKMGIPKNWESNHLGVIKLNSELMLISQAVASGKNDPIKAVAGLNRITQLWEILPNITEAYAKKIQKLGLNPENTIFSKQY